MTSQLSIARVIGDDTIAPDPGGVIRAFARIGYKFQEAVADIVDNSIDAGATQVLIRFFCTDEQVRRVAIADDGAGMSDDALALAMQFGANVRHEATDLGKFGIGMKSASFSQCRSLSVLSMRDGSVVARRWTIEGIRDGWRSERLHPDDARAMLTSDWGAVRIVRHGTVVLWDDLDRLDTTGSSLESVLRSLFRQLHLALGIVYHRIIEKKKIRIMIDAVKFGESAGIAQPVDPVDPFGYEASGNVHYPLEFNLKLGSHAIKMVAHVWPPKSKGASYSLGGAAAARQGFYFYRNDRLIQRGGWNKLREHETDPHFTLARVAVDLPPGLDSEFHLDVQKSSVDVPTGFASAVRECRAGSVSWTDYLRDAEQAYRRGARSAAKPAPVVLGAGVARAVQSQARRALAPNEGRQRRVRLSWHTLPPGTFFELDRPKHTIRINALYRKMLAAGAKPPHDGAIVKALLFLLVRDEFDRERVGRERRQWLQSCNEILVAAAAGRE